MAKLRGPHLSTPLTLLSSDRDALLRGDPGAAAPGEDARYLVTRAGAVTLSEGEDGTLRAVLEQEDPREGDRKSTRLNSSHVSISYAVFCLPPPLPRSPLSPYTTLFRSPTSAPRSPSSAPTGTPCCAATREPPPPARTPATSSPGPGRSPGARARTARSGRCPSRRNPARAPSTRWCCRAGVGDAACWPPNTAGPAPRSTP